MIKLIVLKRLIFFILIVVLSTIDLSAQSTVDSTSSTPFRKGRNLVGISGSISSASINNSQGPYNADKFINKYSFDIKLGKFVANKNLLGIVFNVFRDHTADYVEVEKELLSIGPWYRLYIGNMTNMGLYTQTSVLYTNYVEHSDGVQGYIQMEQELRGNGISGTLGIGYAYVIADKVTFEVGFDYMFSRFVGELIDLRNDNSQEVTFNRQNYQFSFGFNLLFGKMKK